MKLELIYDFINAEILGNRFGKTPPTLLQVIEQNIALIVLYFVLLLLVVAGLYGVGQKIFGKKEAWKAVVPFYGLWQLFYRVDLNPVFSVAAWIPVVGLIPRGLFHWYVARAFGEKQIIMKILAVLFPSLLIPYYGFSPKYEFSIVKGKNAAFENSFRTIMPGDAAGAEASHASQAGIKYQETIEEMRARQAKEAEELRKKREAEEAARKAKAAAGTGRKVSDLFSSSAEGGPSTNIKLPISADGRFAELDQAAAAQAAIAAREKAAREAAERAAREQAEAEARKKLAAEQDAEKKRQMELAEAAAREKAEREAKERAAAEARAREEAERKAREDALRRMRDIAAAEEPISLVSPVTKEFTEPDEPEIENLEDAAGLNDLPGAIRATDHGDEPAGIHVGTIAPIDVPAAQATDISETSAAPQTRAKAPSAPQYIDPESASQPASQPEAPVVPAAPAATVAPAAGFRGIESQIPEPITNRSNFIQTAENMHLPEKRQNQQDSGIIKGNEYGKD